MSALDRVGARPRARWADDDRQAGSVSLLLVVVVFALFIAVGLVVDGGQKLRAVQRADNAAAEAARAALQSVQPAATVRGQPPVVNPQQAINAAQHYLTVAGVTGTVTVTGDQVQVTTHASFTPAFLLLIGLGTQTVTGHGSARLARGVERVMP